MKKESMDMKKILRGALVLVVICLVSGFLLGAAYGVTNPIIEARELAEKVATYQAIFPEAADFREDDFLNECVADYEEILAGSGYEGATVNECLYAVDAAGNVLGYCMSITTTGSQDALTTGVCYGADGVLVGISVLKNSETVGLGQLASEESFTSQFSNKDVDAFTVTKRGAGSDDEIEAITGATITTNAVTLAVNAGMYFADYIIANS